MKYDGNTRGKARGKAGGVGNSHIYENSDEGKHDLGITIYAACRVRGRVGVPLAMMYARGLCHVYQLTCNLLPAFILHHSDRSPLRANESQ